MSRKAISRRCNLEFNQIKKGRATTAAAKILVSNIEKALRNREATEGEIGAAVIPIYGIIWTRETLCALGPNRHNHIFLNIRHSQPSSTNYEGVKKLWADPHLAPTDAFPQAWSDWQLLISNRNIFSKESTSAWIFTARDIAGNGINSTEELAELSRPQMHELKIAHELKPITSAIWYCTL